MSRNSVAEDMVGIFSKIPWWANLILAFVSFTLLHNLAMSFYDPSPRVEIGTMGNFVASKMLSSLALFGQFVMPFIFILAGLIGLIKKCKTTGKFKELLVYIFINLLFFGAIFSKDGGAFNSMKNRVEKPKIDQSALQSPENITKEKETSEAENEVKALQGILDGVNGKKDSIKEEVKVYSWINEKGQKVYSNKPQK